MKAFSFFAAAVLPLLAAAGDYDCKSGSPEKPTKAYTFNTADIDISALSKHFTDAGEKVTVVDVLKSANHQLTIQNTDSWSYAKPVEALKWEAKDGFNDFTTTKWVPQGLTSSADADISGKWEGKDAWVVSWHDKEDTSVRVTFVDRSNKNKYRHVLLVEPDGEDNFKAVPIHAGGILWYKNKLWVPDTNRGIRIFDLDNIWKVEQGDKVGKDGSKYTAQGYAYVIPQVRTYKFAPKETFKHSWISLDREDSTVMVGEYRDVDTVPIRFVKYPLDLESGELKADDKGVVTSAWARCVNILRVQGAVSHGGDFYISRANVKRAPGDVFAWNVGETAKPYNKFLPPGPEDMTFNNITKEFATLTEFPNQRWILNYKDSQVGF